MRFDFDSVKCVEVVDGLWWRRGGIELFEIEIRVGEKVPVGWYGPKALICFKALYIRHKACPQTLTLLGLVPNFEILMSGQEDLVSVQDKSRQHILIDAPCLLEYQLRHV